MDLGQAKIPKVDPLAQDNILFEILSWLPAKSLAISTCVCKQWNALIKQRSFLHKHMEQTPTTLVDCSEASDGAEPDKIVDYCLRSGLLLRKRNSDKKYYIENPITRKVLDVPDPPHSDTSEVYLVYIDSTRDFKLVVFNQDRRDESMISICFGVLTVGKDSHWRTMKAPNAEKHGKILRRSTRLIPDALHCVLAVDSDGESKPRVYVYSFDLQSEHVFVNTLPESLSSDPCKFRAFRWDSCLALQETVGQVLNVLILVDYKQGKWNSEKAIIGLKFVEEIPELKDGVYVFFSVCRNTLIIGGLHKIYYYHLVIGQIVWEGALPERSTSVFLAPSLITFEGMRPRQT